MTGDQQWQTYRPGSTSGETPPAPPKPKPKPTPRPVSSTPRRPGLSGRDRARRAVILGGASTLVVGVVILGGASTLVVGVVGISVYLGSDRDGVPGFGSPDALSADGLDQLRADLRERTGGTEVFRAVIYPGYASVDVPVDDRSQRAENLYWDGDLDDDGTKSTSSYVRVDLAEVDAALVGSTVATAKTLVEDPETWYVIIDGPTTSLPDEVEQDPPSITAYASNEYGESAYVEVDFEGTEVRRSVPDVP